MGCDCSKPENGRRQSSGNRRRQGPNSGRSTGPDNGQTLGSDNARAVTVPPPPATHTLVGSESGERAVPPPFRVGQGRDVPRKPWEERRLRRIAEENKIGQRVPGSGNLGGGRDMPKTGQPARELGIELQELPPSHKQSIPQEEPSASRQPASLPSPQQPESSLIPFTGNYRSNPPPLTPRQRVISYETATSDDVKKIEPINPGTVEVEEPSSSSSSHYTSGANPNTKFESTQPVAGKNHHFGQQQSEDDVFGRDPPRTGSRPNTLFPKPWDHITTNPKDRSESESADIYDPTEQSQTGRQKTAQKEGFSSSRAPSPSKSGQHSRGSMPSTPKHQNTAYQNPLTRTDPVRIPRERHRQSATDSSGSANQSIAQAASNQPSMVPTSQRAQASASAPNTPRGRSDNRRSHAPPPRTDPVGRSTGQPESSSAGLNQDPNVAALNYPNLNSTGSPTRRRRR